MSLSALGEDGRNNLTSGGLYSRGNSRIGGLDLAISASSNKSKSIDAVTGTKKSRSCLPRVWTTAVPGGVQENNSSCLFGKLQFSLRDKEHFNRQGYRLLQNNNLAMEEIDLDMSDDGLSDIDE